MHGPLSPAINSSAQKFHPSSHPFRTVPSAVSTPLCTSELPAGCVDVVAMPPGLGVKLPWQRSRTGCLPCRKRKAKCDEGKPHFARCVHVVVRCAWQDPNARLPGAKEEKEIQQAQLESMALVPFGYQGSTTDSFVSAFPVANSFSVPYLKHFIAFCTKFLTYPNDAEGNPFQRELVPLASQSPALYYAMAALAAGHMARGQPRHTMIAMRYYTRALGALNDTLNNPHTKKGNAVLGACLLLCVYEISHSDDNLWFRHLQGARDLILHRGGPQNQDFLVRFFSLLDISGSLFTGQGPLIPGSYWLESSKSSSSVPRNWPYYDDGVMVDNFHALMVYMAQLSNLSNLSMTPTGKSNPDVIRRKADDIRTELLTWWDARSPGIRYQPDNWRTVPREQPLTVAEKLEEESFSSTRSVVYGCIIYLHHIVDPLRQYPQEQEVADSIKIILEIARETPEGNGLEMGIFFGLFMSGTAIFDDPDSEDLIRRRMSSRRNITIYHADNALALLEALWMKQRHDGRNYDWREVQKEMGLQVFILA